MATTAARSTRGVYVDSSGVRYDTSQSDFEGYLTKQSKWLKDWRRRYFILSGSKLFFTKNEHTTPHGMIDLAECITVKSAESKAGRRNALEVSTREEMYLMVADSEKEKDDWIGAIGRAIVKCSTTYQEGPEGEVEEEEEDDEVEEYRYK